MELQEWKDTLIDKSIRKITFRNNMSANDISELTLVLVDFLDEGIAELKKWRKLKNNDEFLNGIHDTALLTFINDKYLANGRELFQGYSSGGVNASMKVSPLSRLQSSCNQAM